MYYVFTAKKTASLYSTLSVSLLDNISITISLRVLGNLYAPCKHIDLGQTRVFCKWYFGTVSLVSKNNIYDIPVARERENKCALYIERITLSSISGLKNGFLDFRGRVNCDVCHLSHREAGT